MDKRNTEPMVATYLHHKGGALGLPVSGTFELTARCNFSCPMCYVHLCKEEIRKRGDELTARQWISLAEEAKDLGMMFALLTGGEPLLRKDFFEIYDAMKKMGLMISINSNGSLIKGDILKRLLQNPPFRINISLYGGSCETYRNMCGCDAFEDTVSNIKALKDSGVDVRLNLSLTPHNKDDMERIYSISKELGVHIKCNTYMYPPIRVNNKEAKGSERFSPQEAAEYTMKWEKLRLDAEQFSKRASNIVNLCSFDNDECTIETDNGVRCRAGRSSFWLTWDGKLLPCGMMQYPVSEPLKEGFASAWEEIKSQSIEIKLPQKCLTCKNRMICNHCAAVCVTESGAFDGVPEYMCSYSEALVDEAQKYLRR